MTGGEIIEATEPTRGGPAGLTGDDVQYREFQKDDGQIIICGFADGQEWSRAWVSSKQTLDLEAWR